MEKLIITNRLKDIQLIHFVAIIGLVGVTLSPLNWTVSLPAVYWVKQVIEYVLLGCLYAVNVYFFVPKLFHKAKGFIYLIAMIFVVWGMVKLNNAVISLLNFNEAVAKVWSVTKPGYIPDTHWEAKWMIFMAIIVLAVSNISAFAGKSQKDKLALQVFEKEKVRAELSFLKAQINPHFLFNTLHSTYALIDIDADEAKDSLYTLSHMMRYVIYETSHDYTTLAKEIGFVEDYIKLMKTRTPENVEVSFQKPEHIRDVKMAPMLLQPFIENAFKHGVKAVDASYIRIAITEHEGNIRLEVRNLIANTHPTLDLEENDGIGITNTRRRLDLLYPDKYDLQVRVNDQLNEHVIALEIRS